MDKVRDRGSKDGRPRHGAARSRGPPSPAATLRRANKSQPINYWSGLIMVNNSIQIFEYYSQPLSPC